MLRHCERTNHVTDIGKYKPSPGEVDAYNERASQACGLAYQLVRSLEQRWRDADGVPDGEPHNAAPILQGTLGGILNYMVMSRDSDPDEEIADLIREWVIETLPQLRMQKAAFEAGVIDMKGGTA